MGDYRELVRKQAEATGTDPAAALEEFLNLALQIDEQCRFGQECQERKQQLSAHYDYHLKGIPLPEGVKPIPMPRLSKKYGVWKKRQQQANQSAAIMTIRANKLLGGNYLKTPKRSHRGGGDDA